jgi:hypothetical protein
MSSATAANAKSQRLSTYGAFYSTRIPEIALAMTNCWISEVPSKMV